MKIKKLYLLTFVLIIISIWILIFTTIANNKITKASSISLNAHYLSQESSINLKLSSSYYLIDQEKSIYYKQKSDSLYYESIHNYTIAKEVVLSAERIIKICSLGILNL